MSFSPQPPLASKARPATVEDEEDIDAMDVDTASPTAIHLDPAAAFKLLNLPHELLFQILDYLDYGELNAMRSACKALRHALLLPRFDDALFRSGNEYCEKHAERLLVGDAVDEYFRRGCPKAALLSWDGPSFLTPSHVFPLEVHPVLRSLGWDEDEGKVLATWPWDLQHGRPVWLQETATRPPLPSLNVALGLAQSTITIKGTGRGGAVTIEQVLLYLLVHWTHYARDAKKLPKEKLPSSGCLWFILAMNHECPSLWLSFLDAAFSESVMADLAAGRRYIYTTSYVKYESPLDLARFVCDTYPSNASYQGSEDE
ncbi:unnamed protein product [Tilletia controversa]|nr:unnamed protein product [Tilletia controversa]